MYTLTLCYQFLVLMLWVKLRGLLDGNGSDHHSLLGSDE